MRLRRLGNCDGFEGFVCWCCVAVVLFGLRGCVHGLFYLCVDCRVLCVCWRVIVCVCLCCRLVVLFFVVCIVVVCVAVLFVVCVHVCLFGGLLVLDGDFVCVLCMVVFCCVLFVLA